MDLFDLAQRAGLEQRHRGLGPCPLCGATRRGHDDRRPPVTVYWRDGEARWHCKAAGCGGGGDARALAAALRFGEIPPRGDPRWATVLAELDPGSTPARPPRPAPPGPDYPPAAEVAALWAAALPVDTVPTARDYVAGRGLDPRRLTALDLSRALPAAPRLPAWAPVSGPDPAAWAARYALLTPMVDALGSIRSLRFRAVGPASKKALNPRGHGYAGLVMADPLARALLAGAQADGGMRWDGRVVVVEGEPDFWTWACHPARFGGAQTWAVFGIAAGSWTEAIAARIPDRATVVLRVHQDAAGDAYATRIHATFRGRCSILRAHAQPSP